MVPHLFYHSFPCLHDLSDNGNGINNDLNEVGFQFILRRRYVSTNCSENIFQNQKTQNFNKLIF